MSEWWTYSLSDFLMFSPGTYYRLIELYNLAIWPAQVAAAAGGVVVLALLHRGGAGNFRIIAAMLAVAWTWIAWAFLLDRYDTINWAGRYFAAGFFAEALLIGGIGIAAARGRLRPTGDAAHWFGIAIFLLASLGYPLIAVLAGRGWIQAEFFGLAPDPTAIGTLGLALALPLTTRLTLLISTLPVLWCGLSGALLWAMQAPEALLPPVAALLSLVVAAARRHPPHSN